MGEVEGGTGQIYDDSEFLQQWLTAQPLRVEARMPWHQCEPAFILIPFRELQHGQASSTSARLCAAHRRTIAGFQHGKADRLLDDSGRSCQRWGYQTPLHMMSTLPTDRTWRSSFTATGSCRQRTTLMHYHGLQDYIIGGAANGVYNLHQLRCGACSQRIEICRDLGV